MEAVPLQILHLSRLIPAFNDVLTLEPKLVEGVELNATETEIVTINSAFREVSVVLTDVETICDILLVMHRNARARTSENMIGCMNRCETATERCNSCAVDLGIVANIIERCNEKTFGDTIKSFGKLIQSYKSTIAFGGVALGASQLMKSGVVRNVAVGTSVVCACASLFMADDKIYLDYQKDQASFRLQAAAAVKDFSLLRDSMSDASAHTSNAAYALCIGGTDNSEIWKMIGEYAPSLKKICRETRSKLRNIPYFKSSRLCVIS